MPHHYLPLWLTFESRHSVRAIDVGALRMADGDGDAMSAAEETAKRLKEQAAALRECQFLFSLVHVCGCGLSRFLPCRFAFVLLYCCAYMHCTPIALLWLLICIVAEHARVFVVSQVVLCPG